MKVTAINGSPHKDGNSYLALARIGEALKAEGIGCEIIHVGDKVIRGCMACGVCGKRGNGTCAFGSDGIDAAVAAMRDSDGIILASPVHYSGIGGTMKSFLDRAFFVAGASGGLFRHKVGAALVAVRRSGGSSALDCLNHYLSYSEMIVASSNYWNIVHGQKGGEVEGDAEGLQTLDVLAAHLAWMLKMREATRESLPAPERQKKVMTNFVR
jgi:multimeric flavodoxin WrbA